MKDDPLLTAKDFENKADIGGMIIIAPDVEIKIACSFKEVEGMAKGKVLLREETTIMFREEECYLIPSGQFGKILAHAKITLEEKEVTDGEGKSEPEPGDTSIN